MTATTMDVPTTDPVDPWEEMTEADRVYANRPLPETRCFICGGFTVHSEACKALREEWAS